MKGLFLFTKKAEAGKLPPQQGAFRFEAMSFGPCDPNVYRALDALEVSGLVEKIPVPGETWCRYRVTDRGAREAGQLRQEEPRTGDYLAALRDWCDRQAFHSLLRFVYNAYPEYARNSVLPHLRPNG